MKVFIKRSIIILLILFFFPLRIFSRELLSNDNKDLTAGLSISPLLSAVELSGNSTQLRYNSAALVGFGFFVSYDWIGCNATFLHLCNSEQKQSKSERYYLDVIMTDNVFFNRFSVNVIKGTSIASNLDDSRIYYPSMEVIKATDTFLYYFNDNISLKNIYLGNEKSKNRGGAFCAGFSSDFVSINNDSNIFDERVSDDFFDTNYNFSSVTFWSFSPLFGGKYVLLLGPYLNFSFGAELGPSIVFRSHVDEDQGTGKLTIFGLGKIIYMNSLTYTTEHFYISIALDVESSPSARVNNDYLCKLSDLQCIFKAGVRF